MSDQKTVAARFEDLREGMMVRHVSRGGGRGIGRVVGIKPDGVHVEFRDQRVRGVPAVGIYDASWFRGQARLEILPDCGLPHPPGHPPLSPGIQTASQTGR